MIAFPLLENEPAAATATSVWLIHGATAVQAGCVLLVTNDPKFRRIAGLSVVVLDDLLTP